MDQIVKALGLINTVRVDGFTTSVNPTSGARLNVDGGLESLRLTARDGEDAGVNIHSKGFGVSRVSLPTPEDPSISADPYLSQLQVDLEDALFERLAEFAKEKVLAGMHQVVNRVLVHNLKTDIRLTSQKVAHVDVTMDEVLLQQDDEVQIRLLDLSLSVLDYDTKKKPKQAQQEMTVVLRKMRLEIEQSFFERVLAASKAKIPPQAEEIYILLPGPKMTVGGSVKVKLSIKFRVDLRLETENNMFGIYFDRFYVPGTNMKLPGITRNILLGLLRSAVESRAKGLIEVSNESLRINPWSKVPVKLLTRVSTFAVEEGKIVLAFSEPEDGNVPEGADRHATRAEREPEDQGPTKKVLAPGPPIYS